jgi:UDP-N-acetylmuramoylalanine--D-glutamate ligase
MDRYETFNDYAAAKHRIFMNQRTDDFAVLNADDPTVFSWANGLRSQVTLFSVKQQLPRGVFLRGNELISRTSAGEQVVLQTSEMKLRGLHNIENVAAAVAVGSAAGARVESMRETVKRFEPVEHRLEFVAEHKGVKFYNDSKATSVDATLKALEAFANEPGRVVLILGGRGKKAPYAPLAELVRTNVRRLILIGEDADTIATELEGLAPFDRATDMGDAVKKSFAASEQGDVVLLAPACASFDMFDSFEHRGKVFKQEVMALISDKL